MSAPNHKLCESSRRTAYVAIQFTTWKIIQVVIFAMLLCQAEDLIAQPQLLTGHLRDELSHLPIREVHILINGTSIGTTTDSEGFFRLDLPVGEYLVQAQHIGYFTVEMKVHVPMEQPLLISLRPRTLSAPGVMIESTQLRADTLSSGLLLTPRSLLNAPALGEPDPLRAVTLLPSVTVANDLKGDLHIRGGGADESLILLDGMEIQNPHHLMGLFGAFNVEALQDAQFYPSLTSARYGDRLSGALILQSQAAKEGGRAKMNISALASSGSWQRKWRNGGIFLSGRRTYYDVVASLLRQYVGYYFYDGNLHFQQQLSPQWDFTTTGFVNTDQIRPDRGESGLFKWSNRAATMSLRWQRQHWRWQNQINFIQFRINAEDTSDALKIQNLLRELSWQGEFEYHAERTSVLTGAFAKRLRFGYYWEEGKSDDLDEIFYGGVPGNFHYQREQALFGGFIEFTRRLHARVTLRIGARLSSQQDGTALWLPRVSAQYVWPHVGQWRFSFGESAQWQAAGREGIESNIGSPSFPLAQPLRARSATIAFERALPGNFSFNIEAYTRRTKRVARLGESHYPTFEFGKGTTNGLEILLTRERGWLTLQASYAGMKTLHTFGEETYPPDWDIRHSFKGLFGVSLGKNISLHFATQWHSGAPFTPYAAHLPLLLRYLGDKNWEWWWEPVPAPRNRGRLAAYWRSDFLLRKRWASGRRELYLQVLNLLFHHNPLRYETRYYRSGNAELQPRLIAENGLPLLPSLGFVMEF